MSIPAHPHLKVAVIGAGAMGSLYGCTLAAAGHEVWFLCRRPSQAEAIREQGLAIVKRGSGLLTARPHAAADPAEIGASDVVLVCTKSYDTAAAAASLPALVGPGTIVLTLQNGLGNVEALCEYAPSEQVLAGVTYHGAYVSGSGRVDHAGTGPTVVGELGGRDSGRAPMLAAVLSGAGLPTVTADDTAGLLWSKLLINAAINPVSALLRVPNGRLAEMPDALAVMQYAVAEGEAVAQASGTKLAPGDAWARVEEVVRRTGGNRSSMLQDVLHGRRTEIDSINGAIVSQGARLGVPTPVNQTLLHLVRCVEPPDTSRPGG